MDLRPAPLGAAQADARGHASSIAQHGGRERRHRYGRGSSCTIRDFMDREAADIDWRKERAELSTLSF